MILRKTTFYSSSFYISLYNWWFLYIYLLNFKQNKNPLFIIFWLRLFNKWLRKQFGQKSTSLLSLLLLTGVCVDVLNMVQLNKSINAQTVSVIQWSYCHCCCYFFFLPMPWFELIRWWGKGAEHYDSDRKAWLWTSVVHAAGDAEARLMNSRSLFRETGSENMRRWIDWRSSC